MSKSVDTPGQILLNKSKSFYLSGSTEILTVEIIYILKVKVQSNLKYVLNDKVFSF